MLDVNLCSESTNPWTPNAMSANQTNSANHPCVSPRSAAKLNTEHDMSSFACHVQDLSSILLMSFRRRLPPCLHHLGKDINPAFPLLSLSYHQKISSGITKRLDQRQHVSSPVFQKKRYATIYVRYSNPSYCNSMTRLRPLPKSS